MSGNESSRLGSPAVAHIVVVGAGYAGLTLATHLARKRASARARNHLKITLVNGDSRQELTCELHMVLRDGRPQYLPFSSTLKKLGIEFREGQLTQIDPINKIIRIRGQDKSEIKYSTLVLATGLRSKTPSIEGLDQLIQDQQNTEHRIFSFKDHSQINALRLSLRKIGWSDLERRAKDAFVVVLGAGATGIEVAGELAHLRGHRKWARILVVDERNDILSSFSPIGRRVFKSELSRKRIELILGSKIQKMNQNEIYLANGQILPWDLTVLCTGSAHREQLFTSFGDANSDSGIEVRGDLQIIGFPDHYAIGDLARIPMNQTASANARSPKGAQFAVQTGHFLAEYLAGKYMDGVTAKQDNFSATDLGSAISLGPGSGIARLGPALQQPAARILSPFIIGPWVNAMKTAAHQRYLWGLRLESARAVGSQLLDRFS